MAPTVRCFSTGQQVDRWESGELSPRSPKEWTNRPVSNRHGGQTPVASGHWVFNPGQTVVTTGH